MSPIECSSQVGPLNPDVEDEGRTVVLPSSGPYRLPSNHRPYSAGSIHAPAYLEKKKDVMHRGSKASNVQVSAFIGDVVVEST